MYAFAINMFLAFLAAVSPGPNIVLVMQNSAIFGRKSGIMTALGVLVGVFFWLVLLATGFVYLVQKPKVLFAFYIFSSVYLLYIVYLIHHIKIDGNHSAAKINRTFFTESAGITLLNPEIAIFYGSILTGIFADSPYLAQSTSHIVMYLAGFMCVEATVFLSAAYFVSAIKKLMVRHILFIKVAASFAILYFAVKMATHAYRTSIMIF